MKILFIIPYIPYPLSSGGNQAFFNMVNYIRHKANVSILLHNHHNKQTKDIEALKKIWNNVEFYVFTEPLIPDDSKVKIRRPLLYKWYNNIQKSLNRKMKRLLITPNTDITFFQNITREKSALNNSTFKILNVDYINYVADIATHNFDIIQVEFYELLALGYILPKDIQTIFVHHELRYIRNENEMNLFPKIMPQDCMLYRIAKDFERNALQEYKHIITLTEVDKQKLTDLINNNQQIYTSPAVVQTNINSSVQFKTCNDNRLTFVGSQDHYPNFDAVIWFCKDIAPSLRDRNFKFTFQVVGKWHKHIKELQAICPELETVGYVENLSSFLKGSIAIVPIRIGSGMRMKILDAVLSDIPFISTSKGVEGIDLRHGEEYLRADKAIDFADTIIQLCGNNKLQEKLAKQSKERLLLSYNPQEMLEQRFAIYKHILED